MTRYQSYKLMYRLGHLKMCSRSFQFIAKDPIIKVWGNKCEFFKIYMQLSGHIPSRLSVTLLLHVDFKELVFVAPNFYNGMSSFAMN